MQTYRHLTPETIRLPTPPPPPFSSLVREEVVEIRAQLKRMDPVAVATGTTQSTARQNRSTTNASPDDTSTASAASVSGLPVASLPFTVHVSCRAHTCSHSRATLESFSRSPCLDPHVMYPALLPSNPLATLPIDERARVQVQLAVQPNPSGLCDSDGS
ncbi:hypothetical protein CH063_10906 [Colletotrichum higginsianum]|uniref:Uncharacterized protein n=1 Tax=Colletotrichum higginsianum (strain IMI 349063) TaxID=759273 RepID=H1VJ96_COLHI|nr:hypothetical protein CH63R_09277 [Colletotrichum higginsianum IMI 349063]OBR07756.1 hypothetical protein CH63R_09277 [Colletotrichum higginsianum IMI 349063]CCF40299.1 hypothetical protein CH063_10906 [Colletotrichum higginsianum]